MKKKQINDFCKKAAGGGVGFLEGLMIGPFLSAAKYLKATLDLGPVGAIGCFAAPFILIGSFLYCPYQGAKLGWKTGFNKKLPQLLVKYFYKDEKIEKTYPLSRQFTDDARQVINEVKSIRKISATLFNSQAKEGIITIGTLPPEIAALILQKTATHIDEDYAYKIACDNLKRPEIKENFDFIENAYAILGAYSLFQKEKKNRAPVSVLVENQTANTTNHYKNRFSV